MKTDGQFEIAVFAHDGTTAPSDAPYLGMPIVRRRDKHGVEHIERLPLLFTGSSVDEVQRKAAAQFAADRERALRRDANLREAVKKRASLKESAS